MYLKLPNGIEIKLDNSLNTEQRINFINDILGDWRDYFSNYWNQINVRVCLDILSGYICASIIEKHKEDKFVMSRVKFKRMIKGSKNQVNFSNLNPEMKYLFGLVDNLDGQE